MINYYRRLVGSGWAPDQKDYWPTAEKMNAVVYDCDNIGNATKAIADNCTAQSYTATAGYSLSSYKVTDLTKTPLQVLNEAITKWAEQSMLVDLDREVMFGGNVEAKASDFAKMLNEKATRVGCSVKECKSEKFTVAVCQYDALAFQRCRLLQRSESGSSGILFVFCTTKRLILLCQFSALSKARPLKNGDTVYTTGKPCSGCTAAGKKCDNTLGGGLCIA
ncbi:hypothetical protein Y032_0256g349 [Ancylostoma ceylanicum]|nr:hypothetical protein Y032_0256g349 [Ancylostoma ceylanicum]